MKIERLHSNQVRVILTEEDFKDYNVKFENLAVNADQLNIFLFKVMERIKRETDFNPHNGKILVEAKSFSEGVILLVTRIDEDETELKKKYRERYKYARAVKKKENEKTFIYSFDKFDTMCSAVKELPVKVLWNSAIYKMEDRYFFIIRTKAQIDRYHNFMVEYCDKYWISDTYGIVVAEHAELVAKYEKLVRMVNGISRLY